MRKKRMNVILVVATVLLCAVAAICLGRNREK